MDQGTVVTGTWSQYPVEGKTDGPTDQGRDKGKVPVNGYLQPLIETKNFEL